MLSAQNKHKKNVNDQPKQCASRQYCPKNCRFWGKLCRQAGSWQTVSSGSLPAMWSLPTLAVSGPPSYVSSVEWRRGGWAPAIRRLEVFLGDFLGLRQQLQFVCVHTLSCQVSGLSGRNEFSCKCWFGCEGRLLILWNNIWVIVSLSDFVNFFSVTLSFWALAALKGQERHLFPSAPKAWLERTCSGICGVPECGT